MALNFINNLSQQSYTELGLQLLTSLYIKPKVAIKKKGSRYRKPFCTKKLLFIVLQKPRGNYYRLLQKRYNFLQAMI